MKKTEALQMAIKLNITEKEIEEAMIDNVRMGYMEIVGIDENGKNLYRATRASKEHIRKLSVKDFK